jgi:hypothetical protein
VDSRQQLTIVAHYPAGGQAAASIRERLISKAPRSGDLNFRPIIRLC